MFNNLKQSMALVVFAACTFFAIQANARPITISDFTTKVTHVPGTVEGPDSYGAKMISGIPPLPS